MKKTRVTWFKAIDAAKLPGIGVQAGASMCVYDGFVCSGGPMGGGGYVDRMYLVNGAIRIYKRDAHGAPYRTFGSITMAGGKSTNIVGDFIDIPVHMTTGYVCVEEEEVEAGAPTQDPPPAQPVKQQSQQQRR